jgi:hypothetical protein
MRITSGGSSVNVVANGAAPLRMPIFPTTTVTGWGSPREGDIAFDSTTHSIKFYDGSAWRHITGYS